MLTQNFLFLFHHLHQHETELLKNLNHTFDVKKHHIMCRSMFSLSIAGMVKIPAEKLSSHLLLDVFFSPPSVFGARLFYRSRNNRKLLVIVFTISMMKWCFARFETSRQKAPRDERRVRVCFFNLHAWMCFLIFLIEFSRVVEKIFLLRRKRPLGCPFFRGKLKGRWRKPFSHFAGCVSRSWHHLLLIN